MTDYLKRFEELAKELAAIDYITVPEFEPRRPASKHALAAAEKRLGAPLAPGLRDFYEQTNGLKLHWQIKPDVSPALAEELRARSKDYYVEIAEYVGNPFAVIDILPLEDSVLQDVWPEPALGLDGDEKTTFKGNDYRIAELASSLKPLDMLNREFCVGFFLEEGNGDPPVLLLADGYTDWNSSRLTDFASYLELVLVTRGIVAARIDILGEPGGDEKPPLVGDRKFWSRYVPDLFA